MIFLAALPDVDLLLGVFGIQHRTFTHSIFFWSLAFIPFFVKYRRTSIPYFVAVISHILLGDAIVGRNNPLWPIGGLNFSLNYNLISIQNIGLEAAGLAILIIWVLKSKSTRTSFFAKSRQNLWSILPIIPILGFLIFMYSFDLSSVVLQEEGILRPNRLIGSIPSILSNPLFHVEAFLHLVLLCFLSISFVQGLRQKRSERQLKNDS